MGRETLVGNWYEEREWGETMDHAHLKRTAHPNLLSQNPNINVFQTENKTSFSEDAVKAEKPVGIRERRLRQQMIQQIEQEELEKRQQNSPKQEKLSSTFRNDFGNGFDAKGLGSTIPPDEPLTYHKETACTVYSENVGKTGFYSSAAVGSNPFAKAPTFSKTLGERLDDVAL